MKRFRLLLAAMVCLISGAVSSAKTPLENDRKPTRDSFPSFDDITKTVKTHFATSRYYQPGDLVTAGNVGRLFTKLERNKKGKWKVRDQKEILKQVLPDGDWLARQFSTRYGTKFMRAVAEMPGGYDRVDRMRRMPHGEQQLIDLIRSPDGAKMIEYMTTTDGGKNLGKMLSQGVNGADFNAPTGRIYTEAELLKRLKQSYESEAQHHKPSGQPEEARSGEQGTTPSTSTPTPPVEADPFEPKPLPKQPPHG